MNSTSYFVNACILQYFVPVWPGTYFGDVVPKAIPESLILPISGLSDWPRWSAYLWQME